VEKQNSILSFFKTEAETKAITYLNIGSGIIFDQEGYILTRSSIVLGSASNTVTLSNGKEYPAYFVGHDPETGFAVIKIAGEELEPANLGDSDSISLGSWIIIIGNSLGVYPSVVLGSVSGFRKDGIMHVSANLDPGNNGSPVFNTMGEVIGVVAARVNAQPSASNAFLGHNLSHTILAYPINWIKRIAQDIIQFGHVRKGWLGVIGYHDGAKPRIREVIDNSPAHDAGLNVGDVIVRFSGKDVNSIAELAHLVEYSIPGKTVNLDYMRSGKLFNVDIRIGEKSVHEVSGSEKLFRAPNYPIFVDKAVRSWQQSYPSNWLEKSQSLEMRITNLEKQLEKLKNAVDSN
jgi:S1-C subfamily serine protease